jgi:hypothetical protein
MVSLFVSQSVHGFHCCALGPRGQCLSDGPSGRNRSIRGENAASRPKQIVIINLAARPIARLSCHIGNRSWGLLGLQQAVDETRGAQA